MKRIVSALLCLFVGIGSLSAEQVTVNSGVSLRGDPSTKNPPIREVNRNTTVALFPKRPQAGFYHIQTADATKGWVGVKHVNAESTNVSTPTNPTNPTNRPDPTGRTTTTPTSDVYLLDRLLRAHTRTVGQPLIVNQHEIRGPEGDATAQNLQAHNGKPKENYEEA